MRNWKSEKEMFVNKILNRFEPTYEELKDYVMQDRGYKNCKGLSLPMRNWKLLKILHLPFPLLVWAYLWGIERIYDENWNLRNWGLSLPMRNWKNLKRWGKHNAAAGLSLPMRNWKWRYKTMLPLCKTGLSLPMRNWNRPKTIASWDLSSRFEPTYEELKVWLQLFL